MRDDRQCTPASPRPGVPAGRRPPGMTVAAAALLVAGAILCGEALWMKGKAMLAQVLLEHAFASELTDGASRRPWPWADTWPVARVSAPRLGASAIVLASGSGQALAFGPGHLNGTPEPGEPGMAVYAAHRDTHFRFLADVLIGDTIEVTRSDGEIVHFRVARTAVVRWDQSGIDPHVRSVAGLALVTCWPLDGLTRGPLRYVVWAERVSGDGARAGAQGSPTPPRYPRSIAPASL